jgi:adenylosuccinate synthase
VLKRSIQINGVSGLCITKLDVLDGMERIKMGVGYRVGGELLDIFPAGADASRDLVPIYEEMPGWSESTVGVKQLDVLPANARAYLSRLEQICGVPVDMISTGPDRKETIVVRHPFE